jgi:hypothetical protein
MKRITLSQAKRLYASNVKVGGVLVYDRLPDFGGLSPTGRSATAPRRKRLVRAHGSMPWLVTSCLSTITGQSKSTAG